MSPQNYRLCFSWSAVLIWGALFIWPCRSVFYCVTEILLMQRERERESVECAGTLQSVGLGVARRHHTVQLNSAQPLEYLGQGRKLKYCAILAGRWPSIMTGRHWGNYFVDQRWTTGARGSKVKETETEKAKLEKEDTVPRRGPIPNQLLLNPLQLLCIHEKEGNQAGKGQTATSTSFTKESQSHINKSMLAWSRWTLLKTRNHHRTARLKMLYQFHTRF